MNLTQKAALSLLVNALGTRPVVMGELESREMRKMELKTLLFRPTGVHEFSQRSENSMGGLAVPNPLTPVLVVYASILFVVAVSSVVII